MSQLNLLTDLEAIAATSGLRVNTVESIHISDEVTSVNFSYTDNESVSNYVYLAMELKVRHLFVQSKTQETETWIISQDEFEKDFDFTEDCRNSDLYRKLWSKAEERNVALSGYPEKKFISTITISFFKENVVYSLEYRNSICEMFDYLVDIRYEYKDELNEHYSYRRNKQYQDLDDNKHKAERERLDSFYNELKQLEEILKSDSIFKLCKTKGARFAKAYEVIYENNFETLHKTSQEKIEGVVDLLFVKLYGIG